MEDIDFDLQDLSNGFTSTSPIRLISNQENLIFQHFIKCYSMYEEIFTVYADLKHQNQTDLAILKNAEDAVLIKFRLECDREEGLYCRDLSFWVDQLAKNIQNFNLKNLNEVQFEAMKLRSRSGLRRKPVSQVVLKGIDILRERVQFVDKVDLNFQRHRSTQSFLIRQLLASLCSCALSDGDISTSNIYYQRPRPTFQSYIQSDPEPEVDAYAEVLHTLSVKTSQLLLQLQNFEKQGVPSCDHNLHVESVTKSQMQAAARLRLQFNIQLYKTPLSNFNDTSADRRETKLKYAVLELVESELNYMLQLKLLIECFIGGLNHVQSKSLLDDISVATLFSNIKEVYNANIQLWREGIQPLVHCFEVWNAKHIPLDLRKSNGFFHIETTCHPYVKYCLDQKQCLSYYRQIENDAHLKVFVQWFENRPECKRLKIKDFMASPFQRITKYLLLLRAILKYVDEPEQRVYLEEMITEVVAFVHKINLALRDQNAAGN